MGSRVRKARGMLGIAAAFTLAAGISSGGSVHPGYWPVRVTGIVTREDRSPVRGAVVFFGSIDWGENHHPPSTSYRSTTGEDGRFTLFGPPECLTTGWFAITAVADGLAAGSAMSPPSKRHVRIVLGPETRLPVHVVTGAGAALAGMRLLVRSASTARRPGYGQMPPRSEFIAYGTEGSRLIAPITDAHGNSEIRNLPRGGSASFEVGDPEWLQVSPATQGRRELPLGDAPVAAMQTIVARPAARLEGRLVTAAGRPVPGRPVEVGPGGTWTDALGHFRVDRLPAGANTVRVVGPDGPDFLRPEPREIVLNEGERRQGYDIVCPRGILVTGRVLDARTGRPLQGAVVGVGMGDQGGGFSQTDARGRFQFSAREGEHRIEISPPAVYDNYLGTQPVGRDLSRLRLRNGKDLDLGDLRIVLRPYRTLRGRVLKPDGAPAGGANVFMHREGWEPHPASFPGHVTADAKGAFTISYSQSSGVNLFRARSGDLSTPQDTRADLRKPPDLVTLKLQQWPQATIQGQVVDVHGRPVEDALIDLAFPVMAREPPMARTGPDGRFRLEVWPDEECAAYVISEDFGLGQSDAVRPKPGERIELPPIVMRGADAYLDVQVVDRSGKPAAGIAVEIPALAEGPYPLKSTWRTDAVGRVRIAGIARGSYKVRVLPASGSPVVEETVAVPGYQTMHLP